MWGRSGGGQEAEGSPSVVLAPMNSWGGLQPCPSGAPEFPVQAGSRLGRSPVSPLHVVREAQECSWETSGAHPRRQHCTPAVRSQPGLLALLEDPFGRAALCPGGAGVLSPPGSHPHIPDTKDRLQSPTVIWRGGLPPHHRVPCSSLETHGGPALGGRLALDTLRLVRMTSL